MGEGLLLIGAGLIVGIIATLAATRLMAGLLYGVSTTGPVIHIRIRLAGRDILRTVYGNVNQSAPASIRGSTAPQYRIVRGQTGRAQ
jgi:hypothetical protein